MPISHVSLPVADLQASSTFYLKTLAPLGYTLYKEIPDISVGFGIPRAGPDFWISKCPQQEERATEKGARPKIHVAFKASSQRMVHAFYEAAL
jgi:catechol 2,3-dioxygenase-like lactoylglutathione lyase family enzyme